MAQNFDPFCFKNTRKFQKNQSTGNSRKRVISARKCEIHTRKPKIFWPRQEKIKNEKKKKNKFFFL